MESECKKKEPVAAHRCLLDAAADMLQVKAKANWQK